MFSMSHLSKKTYFPIFGGSGGGISWASASTSMEYSCKIIHCDLGLKNNPMVKYELKKVNYKSQHWFTFILGVRDLSYIRSMRK